MPKPNPIPRAWLAATALLIACVAGSDALAVPRVRNKPDKKPPAPAEDNTKDLAAASDASIVGGPMFPLGGMAGLPKYLKCDQQALADPDGIRGGEVPDG